jgi:hypothetical protein
MQGSLLLCLALEFTGLGISEIGKVISKEVKQRAQRSNGRRHWKSAILVSDFGPTSSFRLLIAVDLDMFPRRES